MLNASAVVSRPLVSTTTTTTFFHSSTLHASLTVQNVQIPRPCAAFELTDRIAAVWAESCKRRHSTCSTHDLLFYNSVVLHKNQGRPRPKPNPKLIFCLCPLPLGKQIGWVELRSWILCFVFIDTRQRRRDGNFKCVWEEIIKEGQKSSELYSLRVDKKILNFS